MRYTLNGQEITVEEYVDYWLEKHPGKTEDDLGKVTRRDLEAARASNVPADAVDDSEE